jgi:DNA-binding response OmpR family regulator
MVDSDDGFSAALASAFQEAGIDTSRAGTWEEALGCFRDSDFGLVLLEIALPGLPDPQECRRAIPGLLVACTSLSAYGARIAALRSGFDDYWRKPIRPLEAVLRSLALLRRAPEPERVLVLGDVLVDLTRAVVERSGTREELSMRELILLQYLASHAGTDLPRTRLLAEALGYRSSLTRTLDMHISNLRRKIEPDPRQPRWILTVPGCGYKFAAPGE